MSLEHESRSEQTGIASSETSSQQPNKCLLRLLLLPFLDFLSQLVNSFLAVNKVNDIARWADIKVARETASEIK
jgi:hypothetical protein